MKKIINKEWLFAASIRATKTFFQTFIAAIGTAYIMQDVNWISVFSASFLAMILSYATSFAGLPEVKN